MKPMMRTLSLMTCLAFVSCVTINIYFPAEEVRNAADKIVNEVWGQRNGAPAPSTDGKPQSFWRLFAVNEAVAAQDINIETPEIRAIKGAISQRSGELFPFLDSGNVGLGHDGMLKLRTADGLALKDRGRVTQLLQQENNDRLRLYQEIARANGFPDKTAEVQAIFADSWRGQARGGWYLEKADGSWAKK